MSRYTSERLMDVRSSTWRSYKKRVGALLWFVCDAPERRSMRTMFVSGIITAPLANQMFRQHDPIIPHDPCPA
jgi:hypothetical protein